MKTIVQKYGGSSLATPDLIKKIADRVIQTKAQGYRVVVVVSALGDTTDHLVDLAKQVSASPPPREMDMLLSVGERISISLLVMAIAERGHEAISFTGSQVGIITNTDHTRARILEVRGHRISDELNKGKIVVVAGYQGVSIEKEITTLGRGGSDTTAVALAATLNAERCEIMTDVDGIFTANPRWVASAELLDSVSYSEMLDMANTGAQVLKASAVEFAQRHNIKIAVGSSFSGSIGTLVCDAKLDRDRVTAVNHNMDVALVRVHENAAANWFLICEMAKSGLQVKLISHYKDKIFFVICSEDLVAAQNLIDENRLVADYDNTIGLLSITGAGINFGTDVPVRVNQTLNALQVNPLLWQFSETTLCYGIDKAFLQKAVIAVHDELIGNTKGRSRLGNEAL